MKTFAGCLLICMFATLLVMLPSVDAQEPHRGGAVMVYEIANSDSLADADFEDGIKVLNRRLANARIRNVRITLLAPDEPRLGDVMSSDTHGLKVDVTYRHGMRGIFSGRDLTVSSLRDAMSDEIDKVQSLLRDQGTFELMIAADVEHSTGLVAAAFADGRSTEVSFMVDGEVKARGRWVSLRRNNEGIYDNPPGTAILRLAETGQRLEIGDSSARFGTIPREYAGDEIEILLEVTPEDERVRLDHMLMMEAMIDSRSKPAIQFKLNEEGAMRLNQLTTANVRRHLCVVIDDQLLIAPRINEPISADGMIQGNFIQEEVHGLVAALNFPSPLDLGGKPAAIEYVLPAGDR